MKDFGKACRNARLQPAATVVGGVRRLDQLPPAALVLTVIHTENGCQQPVVVRYGIAGNAGTASPIGAPARHEPRPGSP